MPTTVVKVVELSREIVEINRANTIMVDTVDNLRKKLENFWSVERLTCVDLEMVVGRVRSSETDVKHVGAKYAKMMDRTAQTEMDLLAHSIHHGHC